ncbi:S8 family serine peptidase [Candidatus Woesearchaeota archaeon]|nr:S8 family serine peptidase [Candidatus Woesearchaeota archaeon]
MAIYASKTRQGILFYSSSQRQCIFRLGDLMIGSGEPIRDLLERSDLERFGRDNAEPGLEAILHSINRAGRECFIAAPGEHPLLISTRGGGAEYPDEGDVLYSGTDKKTQMQMLKSFHAEDIGDAITKMYRCNRVYGYPHNMQIGVVKDSCPFVFYSGDESYMKEESHMEDKSPLKNRRRPENKSYLIDGYQKNIGHRQDQPSIRKLNSILEWTNQISGVAPLRAVESVLKKKAEKLILSQLDKKDSCIRDRLLSLDIPGAARATIDYGSARAYAFIKNRFDSYALTVKKSISNYGKAVQDELDRIYHSKKRQDIIIRIKDMRYRTNSIKTEIAGELSEMLGSDSYHIYDSIPFISVSCEQKDKDKACHMLNNKRKGFFRGMTGLDLELIMSAQPARGFYIPEMFIKKAGEMRLKIPYSWSKKNKNMSMLTRIARKAGMWNLKNIGAYRAWDVTKGNGSTTVVIDTGIEYTHPEISSRFSWNKGWNFIDDNDDIMDDNGHGTHCAGIVAGMDTGVAPESCLVAAKVLDKSGCGTTTDILAAIDYVIKLDDADIISMSLGSRYYSQALDMVCGAAYDSGLILCAAAGNEYFGPSYPAACTGVISVAAVDMYNKHADFSNIDSSVDISCPGVDIYSCYLNGSYTKLSGTSMATPHDAGTAALAVSVTASLDPSTFEKIMTREAQALGEGESDQKDKYGAGLARPDKIVNRLQKKLFKKEGIINNLIHNNRIHNKIFHNSLTQRRYNHGNR